jgi:hypothetical protein
MYDAPPTEFHSGDVEFTLVKDDRTLDPWATWHYRDDPGGDQADIEGENR